MDASLELESASVFDNAISGICPVEPVRLGRGRNRHLNVPQTDDNPKRSIKYPRGLGKRGQAFAFGVTYRVGDRRCFWGP